MTQFWLACRSALFSAGFIFWTGLLAFSCLPLMLGPRRWTVRAQWVWSQGVMLLLKLLVGIGYKIEGLENLPEGPCLVASKHQSTWETIVFNLIFADPAYVLKRELLRIPVYGWYARRSQQIPIDRSGGGSAMRLMLRAADRAVRQGRAIVIYPEGTRVEPGAAPHYHAGVVGLYRHLGLPTAPVALTSGLHWGRRRFLKRPGVIRLAFLPPIPPGLSRLDYMAALENAIETKTNALMGETDPARFGANQGVAPRAGSD